MSNKTDDQQKTKLSKNNSLVKVEIWFPDESVFGVELPVTLTIKELLHEVSKHFDLNQQLWSFCSSEGKIYLDDEIVHEIVGDGKELRLKRLRMIPKATWG